MGETDTGKEEMQGCQALGEEQRCEGVPRLGVCAHVSMQMHWLEEGKLKGDWSDEMTVYRRGEQKLAPRRLCGNLSDSF